MKTSYLFGGLIAAVLMLPVAAMAQSAAPPQAGAPLTPTDVKPIGDWTVRCFPVTSSSPCDMYEELDDKNSHQRVLGVSIAFVPGNNNHVAQIAVPLGVAIASGAVIKTDSYTSPKMPFRRCDRDGCYVELLMSQDTVDSLAKSGPEATVNIVADGGKPFALRFSLNGFAGAHESMSGLARQKATAGAGMGAGAPPAAAPAPGKKK
jgi:invasion protein IalB